MPGRTCAYCGAPGPLTGEHLFPDFLTRVHPTYGTYLASALPHLVTSKAPIIKDVCETCNNVRLGDLDQYASSLCREYLRRFVKPSESGHFEYDYHKLCRWLWKLGYNSARTGDDDPVLFTPLTGYILGETASPPFPQTVLVGVLRADASTDAERQALGSPFFYPRLVRLGSLSHPGIIRKAIRVGRLVSINSYVFWIICWEPVTSRQDRRFLVDGIAKAYGMVALSETGNSVDVPEFVLSARQYLARRKWPIELG